MKRSLCAPIAALALLLLAGTFVHADPLPPNQVSWNYNWAPGSPAIFADGNPAAGVTFTNEPTKKATGSSDVVATNMRVFSGAVAASPDTLTGSNGNYTLALQLSIDGQPAVAPLIFSGKLSGSFSAESSNVANAFTDAGPKVVEIGSYRFTVSLIAYTPPGPPDQANAGSISAHVTLETITPNNVPEPSSIVLTGMGLTFLGGAALRRFRNKRRVSA